MRKNQQIEKVLIVLMMFLLSGSLVSSLNNIGVISDTLNMLIWGGLYAGIFLLLILRWREGVARSRKDLLTLLLVAIAVFSLFWSDDRSMTLHRSLSLVLTTLFGIDLGTRYALNEWLRLIAWTLGTIILCSFCLGLFFPSYGIDNNLHVGAWQGVFVQKNLLGRFMVLGLLIFSFIGIQTRKNRWIPWLGVISSLILLVLSTSRTGIVVSIGILVLFGLFRSLRWRTALLVPFIIFLSLVTAGVTSWIVSNFAELLKWLGRDITLTGRTVLWDAVYQMIQQRLLLGYGYGGFWLGLDGPSAYVWEAVQWNPPHAHNGFLDLWLDVGLVGLTIFVLGFLRNYWRAIQFVRSTRTVEGFWPLLYFTFFTLYNITESIIINQNGYFFWMIYVGTISWLLQQVYQAKLPQMDQTTLQQPDESFGEAPISSTRNMRVG